ncbi:hypothetical protein LINPERHAP1_LOCUS3617 [Linum perenne]
MRVGLFTHAHMPHALVASNIEDTEGGDLENQRLKLRKRTMKRLSKSESCSGEANLIAAAVKAAARDLEWRNRKLWFD